jgi:hypothetical protein
MAPLLIAGARIGAQVLPQLLGSAVPPQQPPQPPNPLQLLGAILNN